MTDNAPAPAAGLAGATLSPTAPRLCKLGATVAGLPTPTRTALLDALHGNTWSDARLSKLLGASGHGHHSTGALGNHRRGDCICTTTGTEDA